MVRRISCLLCAAVLVLAMSAGVSANPVRPAALPAKVRTSRTARRPPALVSAMLLVLAGVSVTLLFDKKE